MSERAFASLEHHRERIAQACDVFPRWKLQTLAFLSAQRSLAGLLEHHHSDGAAALLDSSVEFLWSAFMTPVDTTLYQKRVEGLIPDAHSNKPTTRADRHASLVAYPVAYALQCVSVTDPKALKQNAVWATQTETDMSYFLAGSEVDATGLRPYSEEHERAIAAHPAHRATISAQQEDLAALEDMSEADSEQLKALRERAKQFRLGPLTRF
jgi:hypothetical protein